MSSANQPVFARYIGYTTGTENHGDEALMWIIRDLLAPEIEVVFDDAHECELALLGGGTLINQSPWLLDSFGTAIARARGAFTFGSGVGDTFFWGNNFVAWNALLRKCQLIGVRGPESRRLLGENGFGSAEIIGDPYLALQPPLQRTHRENLIGVNFGNTNDALIGGGTDKDYIEYLVSVLSNLQKGGANFVWFSVWSNDIPIIQSVRDRMADSGPLLDARMQSLETLSALAGCEVVIAEKLHASAIAAVAGVPFIALEYQPKVRDFAQSIAMDDFTVSSADRNAGALLAKIADARSRREELRIKLFSQRELMRERIHSFAARVKQHYAPGAVAFE